jgi:hypothetical protein
VGPPSSSANVAGDRAVALRHTRTVGVLARDGGHARPIQCHHLRLRVPRRDGDAVETVPGGHVEHADAIARSRVQQRREPRPYETSGRRDGARELGPVRMIGRQHTSSGSTVPPWRTAAVRQASPRRTVSRHWPSPWSRSRSASADRERGGVGPQRVTLPCFASRSIELR